MRKIFFIVVFSAGVFWARTGFADWRHYVWTYEYMTMRKGTGELEFYLTEEISDINRSDVNTLKPWIELEYGITNRWDVAIYQQFKHRNKAWESDFENDGLKLRTRYRFGEKDQYWMDPLVYFEWIREDNLHKPNVGEAKLILAKDTGNLNISYNQIIKRNLEREGITEHEYALGINRGVLQYLYLGLESKGNYTKDKYYLGPTLSWADKHHKFWVAFGLLWGLNTRSDDLQTRLIVGIPF